MFLGSFPQNCRCFWEYNLKGEAAMKKRNYKGRCKKRNLSKCQDVCRTYNAVQSKYADILNDNDDVISFSCNVPLDNTEYTTDFVYQKTDNDFAVRECVSRNLLTKPLTVKLLDISRNYWLKHGITDWGIVTNEE